MTRAHGPGASLGAALARSVPDTLTTVLARFPYRVVAHVDVVAQPSVSELSAAAAAAAREVVDEPGPVPVGMATWRPLNLSDQQASALVLVASAPTAELGRHLGELTGRAVHELFEWYPDVAGEPTDALATTLTAFRAALRQLATGRHQRTLVLYHYIAEEVLVTDVRPHHTVRSDGTAWVLDTSGPDGVYDLVDGAVMSGAPLGDEPQPGAPLA